MSKEDLMPKMIELSKKYGCDLNEIDRYFNSKMTEFQVKNEPNPENWEFKAWTITQLEMYRKYGKKDEEQSSTPKSEPGDLEGFLVGLGEYRDKKAEMLKYIERQVKDGGKTKAQQNGLIKTDGVSVIPLDYRTEVFGKKNPDCGKPLSEINVNTEMKVYGVFRRADTEDAFVFGTLETANSAIANSWFKSLKFPEHLFVPMKTNGNIHETELGFRITASQAEGKVTKFTIDKHPSYEVYDAFMMAVEPLLTPWSWPEGAEEPDCNPMLRHYLDAVAKGKNGKPAWDRMIFVRGIIDQIRPEWKNWKGTPAYICNENDVVERIKINLPDGFEKMFGEGSIVIAYGKDEETMRKNENTGKWDIPSGRIEIRCVGAYPIPGFKTTPTDGGKVKLKEFNAVVME